MIYSFSSNVESDFQGAHFRQKGALLEGVSRGPQVMDNKKFGIIICMNLKPCDESSIFINYNAPIYFVTLYFSAQWHGIMVKKWRKTGTSLSLNP